MNNASNSLIKIVPYNELWPQQYEFIASNLREILPNVMRIDHIGSTSIRGLAAKDIIDIQVTVKILDEEILGVLQKNSYQVKEGVVCDSLVNSIEPMHKYFSKERTGERRANIHIRKDKTLNQRYALLFRDYLRNCATTREAYLQIKKRLAMMYPHDINGYLSIKDPVMDIIFMGAEMWATKNHWSQN
ncbi:GrpB family protein [Candidatus Uabimicrobium sp. HlEnr_7]|uniref:GrpB family protein n=1 Tax=Candidatus Uabimicrobium helgolandensis TaxID=3095367 RepID=UPI003555D1B4